MLSFRSSLPRQRRRSKNRKTTNWSMRNEFVYFAKSIPRWITVDAPDSRCIKAATDKFPPGGAQKTAFSRRRGWIWSLVAPRSISLGRHGSRCWIPIVRGPRVHTRAPRAREDAPSARRTTSLLVRIGRLSRVYHTGQCAGIAHCCLYLRVAA